MASPFIFHDGFDLYGPPGAPLVLTTLWTTLTGGSAPTIVGGLSSPGYAARFSGNGNVLTKNLGASYTRVAGCLRFSTNLGATSTANLLFANSGAYACCFVFDAAGTISFRTGSAGAVIATGGAIIANSSHVLSWDITIGATAAYSVFIDGTPLYSGTGNTANGQASINQLVITLGGANIIFTTDDLVILDPAQPAYNSAILTSNPVIETQFASGDNQTQFASDGNAVPAAGVATRGIFRATATNLTTTANSLYLLKITPEVNCTVQSISAVPSAASGTAKYRGVLYADSGGAPAALMNAGTEVVATTAGATLTLPLSTPQPVTGGTSYWIGFINDTAVGHQQYDASTNLALRKANTYTSGPPSPAGTGFTTGIATLLVWANCNGAATNWPSVSLSPPLGTAASQIHSATVGQEDLYTFDALVTNPATIFGMSVRGFVSKSDAGARTLSLNAKSGASDTSGSAPGQALATTQQWQTSYFDVDPATGVAWTASGANAAKAGVSVAS